MCGSAAVRGTFVTVCSLVAARIFKSLSSYMISRDTDYESTMKMFDSLNLQDNI